MSGNINQRLAGCTHLKTETSTEQSDPCKSENYPGFNSFTECGRNRDDGEYWKLVLED